MPNCSPEIRSGGTAIRIKKRFDDAYQSLCDTIYKVDGYSYRDSAKQTGKCPDLIRADLLELKLNIDMQLKYAVRGIEKHLNIKEYE